jgi:hypothetical protein
VRCVVPPPPPPRVPATPGRLPTRLCTARGCAAWADVGGVPVGWVAAGCRPAPSSAAWPHCQAPVLPGRPAHAATPCLRPVPCSSRNATSSLPYGRVAAICPSPRPTHTPCADPELCSTFLHHLFDHLNRMLTELVAALEVGGFVCGVCVWVGGWVGGCGVWGVGGGGGGARVPL